MRVLMLTHDGTNSRDIFLDVEAGFREAGHEVIRWELGAMERVISRANTDQGRRVLTGDMGEVVRQLIETNGVDFSLGMWTTGITSFGIEPDGPGGVPMSFFERIGHPQALFWLDAPHWAHRGSLIPLYRKPIVAEKHQLHIINNDGLAEEMTGVFGFGNVMSRGYGVNPHVFRPRPEVEACHDIVFNLGPGDPPPTAMMLGELESDEPDIAAIRSQQIEIARSTMAAAVEGFTDLKHHSQVVELVDLLVRSQLDGQHTRLLDRLKLIVERDAGLGEGYEELISTPSVFVSVSGIVRSVEVFYRAFVITYLSKHFDCAVFGDDKLDAWPHKLRRYGATAYDDLSKMYGLGRLGLNTMRWQDDIGLNIKPMEITASGRACLCGMRGGLGEMFEIGTEIAAFESPSDARRAADELLQSPEKREAMAIAGRARTLRDHTWAKWADDVCDRMRKLMH